MITEHVQPAAHLREPYIAQPRPCPVCSLDLPAGYGRHPTCDPRWLQPASSATGSDTSAEATRSHER